VLERPQSCVGTTKPLRIQTARTMAPRSAKAKVDLLWDFGKQALPVYWASFTLVGDRTIAIFS
jgi:hypothetical protein